MIKEKESIDKKVTTHLNVSRIMVNRTNLPRRGTTREVGGMISAKRRKKTVSERRMLIERLTLKMKEQMYE